MDTKPRTPKPISTDSADIEFLVISEPPSHGDRHETESKRGG